MEYNVATVAKEIKRGNVLSVGDTITRRVVTHIKKSRQYSGFYTVQYQVDGLDGWGNPAVKQVDLKWNAAVIIHVTK